LAVGLIRQQKGLLKNRVSQRSEKGQLLIEVLVAMAILGIVAVAFLTALTTSAMAIILADENTMAESLTRTELENITNRPYPIPPVSVKSVLGYEVNTTAVYIDKYGSPSGTDLGMQQITVEIRHQDKLVLTTSAYKVR